MPTTDQFQTIYNRLNFQQKKAVNNIEGPVMVVAGPGTGKTQVLAARIANILLKTDTNPRSILALTFTESATKEMRQRLVGMIGKTGYYVQISTFHAFCSWVIKMHPEYFPIDRGSEPLSELERYDIFQKIIDESSLEILKPLNRPYFYISDILFAISNLKREGFLPTDFKKVVKEEQRQLECDKNDLSKIQLNKRQRDLAKWQELTQVYKKYQQRLRSSLRYDFDDMISLVVEAFDQHELLLREYQENIHYFLVDEYQDTNSAQNKVVDQLASYWGDRANVFVVGDPNQSIYRFQGASIENVLGFVSRYKKAQVITLDTGYRCPQNIYNAAAKLISQNQLTQVGTQLAEFSFTDPLKSHSKQKLAINLYQAPSQILETIYIAQEIIKLQKKNIPLEQIAVLYRHNRDAVEIRETLDKWGLVYEIDGGNDLLENEMIRQLLTFFQVINDVRTAQEDERLFEVMRYEWLKLDPVLVMKVGRAAGKAGLSIFELIESGYLEFAKYDLGNQISPLEFEQLPIFISKLCNWGSLDAKVVFPEWFEKVIKESGFLAWMLESSSKTELLIYLNSLFREVKALSQSRPGLNLRDFLEAIATMKDHGIKLNVEDLNVKQNAVHLSTVHRAKGLEWDYVFLLHCLDGKWGNNRVRELLPLPEGLLQNTDLSRKEQNEDERRLFYVALTRARKQLTISSPETVIANNRTREVIGSMFVEELRDEATDNLAVQLTKVTAPQIIKQADKYLAKLLEPVIVNKLKTSEEEFYQQLIKDFKLSVTALNTYLRNPAEFVENVLLRIPRAKPEPMAFGSAIHQTLEKLFKFIQDEGQLPELNLVLCEFNNSLTRELMTSQNFQRRLSYGRDILAQYYQQLAKIKVEPLFIERFFGFGWSKTILDDIHLTGRIDRVDWLDKEKKLVKVIDYKTGKAKSGNYIEGKIASAGLSEREQRLPESIRGPYKRQLLFYKLLADLDETFIPTVTEGEFDFVEPNDRGKLVKRSFILTEEDVNDLKDLIKEVMREIRSLKFLELI
ncbi:ATP-dependent helicase [Patescibacteria group bacterium]|nr:ATP-dependent helicase [Patescibacteria group bacterium]